MLLDFSTLNETQIYKLMSNTVTPRPIAWIATEHDNITNLAPFSYFIPLSSNPPTLIVSIGHKDDDSPKDTLANLLNHSKVTITFVDLPLKDKMVQSATSLPATQSEFEVFNIPSQTLLEAYPPMVEGAKAAFFCSFMKIVELEGSETIPCLLRVEHAFYADDVIDEGLHVKLSNIGRVGGKFIQGADLIP